MNIKITFSDGSIVNTPDANLQEMHKFMKDCTPLFISIKSPDGLSAQSFIATIVGIEETYNDVTYTT